MKKEVIYMELKLDKKDVLTFIEDYYKKTEERVVKARIESQKVSRGYGRDEYDVCSSVIKLEEEVTLLGSKAKLSSIVSESELKNIFTNILEESGYEVERIAFDDGLTHEQTGYYMYEQTFTKPYCNGLILNVKKLAKQKKMGGK